MDIQRGDVSHIIQLAIAPVFLLTGLGTNLMVLTNRLARIIDHSRILDERWPDASQGRAGQLHSELETLHSRAPSWSAL